MTDAPSPQPSPTGGGGGATLSTGVGRVDAQRRGGDWRPRKATPTATSATYLDARPSSIIIGEWRPDPAREIRPRQRRNGAECCRMLHLRKKSPPPIAEPQPVPRVNGAKCHQMSPFTKKQRMMPLSPAIPRHGGRGGCASNPPPLRGCPPHLWGAGRDSCLRRNDGGALRAPDPTCARPSPQPSPVFGGGGQKGQRGRP